MAQKRRSGGRVSEDVKKNVKKKEMRMEAKAQLRDEILGIILVAVGIFLIVALQTSAAGIAGEAISKCLKGVFGFVAFLLPYYFIIYGILLFFKKTIHVGIRSVIYLLVIYLAIALVNAGRFVEQLDKAKGWGGFAKCFEDGVALDGGGVFGMGVGSFLANIIGVAGLYIFSFVLIIIFVLLLVNTPVSRFIESIKLRKQRRELIREEKEKEERLKGANKQGKEPVQDRIASEAEENFGSPRKIKDYMSEGKRSEDKKSEGRKTGRRKKEQINHPEKLTKAEAAASKLDADDFITQQDGNDYAYPPVELLKRGNRGGGGDTEEYLNERARFLEEVLESYGIAASVTNVIQGPTVTRYEVHPHSGVKVAKIKSLINDIALNMAATTIRIEAPIPGKKAVGIEIENERPEGVAIREIIQSEAFRNSKSPLSFAVGKDVYGKEIVADLASMPHLLIAGATGSGKSVCINGIITSILYKANPDKVKMILIDPKVVELSDYNGIPHLLIPVVTDPAKAAAALNWAVAEMDERYKKFARLNVKGIFRYNEEVVKEKHKVVDGEVEGPIPQIVIVIDELADLMMVASSQVEESICRLAQKARAAGIHLIVATQRPSVNVITGLIKANIPSRIAFQVTSQVDSRTILDSVGAERLIGKGDMLFAPADRNDHIRIQSPFISDDEVKKVIEFVRKQADVDKAAEADVLDTISRANTPDAEKGNRDLEDDLLPEAIEEVVKAGNASVSMLQRKFRIGYNRAARIIDMMEDRQIVGPPDGSRPRLVLITEEDLENMKESVEDK